MWTTVFHRQFMSRQGCEELMSTALDFAGKVGNEWVSGYQDAGENLGYRKCEKLELPYMGNPLKEYLSEIFHISNQHIGVDICGPIESELIRYSESGDHFDWHTDAMTDFYAQHRKLSLSLQLSDPSDYDGCELEIEDVELNPEWKEQGCGVVFASTLRHRVTPIRRGTRYALIAWQRGPQWR